MQDLQNIGTVEYKIRLFKVFYCEKAGISTEGELSEWTYTKRVLHQGCVLSLTRSLLMSIMRRMTVRGKITIIGVPLSNIRYTDATVIDLDDKDLQSLLTSLKEKSERRGLNINKNKIMFFFSKKANDPEYHPSINNEPVE